MVMALAVYASVICFNWLWIAANWAIQLQTSCRTIESNDLECVKEFAASRKARLHEISGARLPSRLIFVMMESMETWPIGLRVDGREITPCLNRIISDTVKTLYVPYIEPEVAGGRSSDAQLIDLCGLLPPEGEIYSFSFPGNRYPSIINLFKKATGGKAYMFTLDLPSTYNIGVMHRSMGFDSLFSRTSFPGNPRLSRKSDAVLFRHSAQVLTGGENPLWHDSEPGAAMLITYSCHVPFHFPGDIDIPAYPESMGRKISRYLRNVSYTDFVIGEFVDSLRANCRFDSTMIVITGDHNAFGRKERLSLHGTFPAVSKEPYIPLIVVNSPVGGTVETLARQSDIYPTLLRLTALAGIASWPGVGRSVLESGASDMDTAGTRNSISNLVIRYDLLR